MLNARFRHTAGTRTHFMLRMIVVFILLVQQDLQDLILALIIRVVIRIILVVITGTWTFGQQVPEPTGFRGYDTVVLSLDDAVAGFRRPATVQYAASTAGRATTASGTSALTATFLCPLDGGGSDIPRSAAATSNATGTASTAVTAVGADAADGTAAQRGRLRGLLKRTEGEGITEGVSCADRGRAERAQGTAVGCHR